MGLVVACLGEDGDDGLADTNNVAMGGLPYDWDKDLSSLRQLEGKLFMRHVETENSMAIVVALAVMAAWTACPFVKKLGVINLTAHDKERHCCGKMYVVRL